MKARTGWAAALVWLCVASLQAQADSGRYIEVTGVSEIEIVPDEIHYIVEIKEYFEEEFDGKSKPEHYRTKVPLPQIEQMLRAALSGAGIPENAVRTQEIGDYRRERGHDFLIAKQFDITLKQFEQINDIIKNIDTKGINTMRIGELKSKNRAEYLRQGKIEALKVARRKAEYLVEALGKKLGDVIRIVETDGPGMYAAFAAQSNVRFSDAGSFDGFRTIKQTCSMLVRFGIEGSGSAAGE